MAAVREFTLPDLGEGLTEAEIVRWLVEVGEVVAVDQPVVEVETAKAVVEVPCPYGGVVTARFGEEGDTLTVGRPLVTVAVGSGSAHGRAGGPVGGPGRRSGGRSGEVGRDDAAGGDSGESGGDRGSGNVLVGYGTGSAAARRRNRVRAASAATAAVDGVATSSADSRPVSPKAAPGAAAPPEEGQGLTGPALRGPALTPQGLTGPAAQGPTGPEAQGPTGPAHQRPAPAQQGPVAVISPLVRRIAREHGLDLRALTGTGPDGLILRADVEHAVAEAGALAPAASAPAPAPAPAPAAAPAAAPAPAVEGVERIALRGVRGAAADKLSRSRREIPDATCWVDADATELLAARVAMNAAAQASGAQRISVLALLARITTAALARFPELNATVDTERGEIVRLPAVHLGFAAQTERGLVVPVVRDAQSRTTAGLAAETARLTEAARDGSLTPAELTGGTFTLNNYGVFGVDGSTPILNHPEAAMLGVGRIVPKPWVYEGELAVRQVVQLSFTFDHRVCDGGTAGGFLRFVADCVENPAVLLSAV
ncbi:dihydrolipoamide acetyltransferase family protein [Streptomyces sp.]|uniref:dihydrolipoamide acetyltransferase family protein n=1 Tax=Streptomyces sp. TaxID=1931 RepID=UPI002F424ECD